MSRIRPFRQARRLFSTNGRYITPLPWQKSVKASLGLLVAAIAGISGYTFYKVGYRHETLFLPLWFCRRERKPLKSELDRDLLLALVKSKLHDRLSVDEEVHLLLGTPVTFDDHSREDEYKIYIRTSEPGIKGLVIEPSWAVTLAARPFMSRSGIDRVLAPYVPGMADSEDAISLPNDHPQYNRFRDAVVQGRVTVTGDAYYSRLRKSPLVDKSDASDPPKALLEFIAVQSLDHPKSAPKFVHGVLHVKDSATGEITSRRLW
ncbi:hypothetical protein TRVA0_017S01134 [Trichomonascus vanleenenianus]|uniref:uncharacterized protein n=1 Tax=Trichomonascus vanleenenianus TaxID=2268995 RepID=UPI003ECAFD2B